MFWAGVILQGLRLATAGELQAGAAVEPSAHRFQFLSKGSHTLTEIQLVAACNRLLNTEREVCEMDQRSRDWFLNKPGHADAFTVARALRSILETGAIPRKGPQMADTSQQDPVAQVEHWLKEYLVHVECRELATKVNHALVFRITRTMFLQGKALPDVQAIIVEMAKSKTKPKSIGYLISVIEGNLGKVA